MSITLDGTNGITQSTSFKSNTYLDAAGGNTATINGKLPIAIGDVPAVNIQTFSASGTWTKPAGAKVVFVRLGGGGGGGAALTGTSGVGGAGGRMGGGGGGGGARTGGTAAAGGAGGAGYVEVYSW